MKPTVYAKIPRTGLANCLFVWAHAMVFAKEHDLPLVVGRWNKFRWGALLRREQKNRLYAGYFKETPVIKLLCYRINNLFSKKIYDPPCDADYENMNGQFIFTKSIQDNDLFRYLRPHVDLIRKELFYLLTDRLQDNFRLLDDPEIGIHVRRGDFKKGNPITPNEFFIFIIKSLRNARGSELPVTVFTDGKKEEIQEILDLPKVYVSDNKEDILDLLALSKSHFMILSRSSTFSYWAAFLSNAVVYMDAHDWQEKIKDKSMVYREARIDVSRIG